MVTAPLVTPGLTLTLPTGVRFKRPLANVALVTSNVKSSTFEQNGTDLALDYEKAPGGDFGETYTTVGIWLQIKC